MRTQLFQDFADRYFPSAVTDGRVDAKTAADHARLITGRWQASRQPQSNFLDILNLFGQISVGVDGEGALVIPSLKGAGGGVQRWVEISPFVWRDENGHDRLAARVVDGKPVRWSFDLVAPFTVYDRVPASRSAALLKPAIVLSLAVLLLTFLYWPITWFLRRRYKQALAVTGPARKAYRATRVMAGLDLALLAGWAVFVMVMFGSIERMTARIDTLLWLLQLASAAVFMGAVGISGWNAWLTWTDGRHWARKLWSAAVLLATLVVLYVAGTFGLLSMTVNY